MLGAYQGRIGTGTTIAGGVVLAGYGICKMVRCKTHIDNVIMKIVNA